MLTSEESANGLQGIYHDMLRGPGDCVVWDRGWKRNAIVKNCRQLLAGFMGGTLQSLGIQGLRVGRGSDDWDLTAPPMPLPTQTALIDANSFLLPRTALQIDFLSNGIVTNTPTNQLQIVATLGPNRPPWPDANHATGNLREFGLVGKLNNAETLINYVTHPVIVKDPASTLTRTIWLTF